jgi:hypothetical protein
MKKHLLALLSVLLAATGFQSDHSIRIDGVMAQHEWQGAEELLSGDGYRLLLKKKNEILYGVMTGGNKFWAHLYISDNSFIKVMHASAALGSVEYKRNNKVWVTMDTFNYELRDTIYNSNTATKMSNYFSTYGWVANNNNLGSGNVIEFKVNIKKMKGPLYFACVIANNDMTLHGFPVGLKDNTILPRLVQGYAPDSLSFEPGTWKRIK